MGKTYFISDLHFGHKNCLAYDNRPFLSIEEHDEAIISNWANKVNDDDDVWILGDISWYKIPKTIDLLGSLKGRKHLCIGNHDKHFLSSEDFRKMFVEICHYKELKLEDGRRIVLSHYPIPCFNKHYYGDYHLYGHVHTGFEHNMMKYIKLQMEQLYDTPCNMHNVGCMLPHMDYTPRTLDEIIEGDIYE